ncbi:MAG: MBL fold metallo-hydrolase [Bdellovibrionales bacterium]
MKKLWMILLLFELFSTSVSCASSPYPVSDHFDGKTFRNTPPTRTKSFFEVAKWQWTREKVEWPDKRPVTVRQELAPVQDPKAIAVTFVNHSTFVIQTQDFNFLTDPIWSDRSSPFQWVGPKRAHDPGVQFESLPPIHYVLVSHNHYDHMDASTLKRLHERFKTQFLVPLGDKKNLQSFGVPHGHEMDWWDEFKISEDVKIVFTRCQHWSARGLFDRNESLWGSYLLIYKGKKIFFAGDTGYADHFTEIERRYGAMDLALLPIGAYEPRTFMREHHMNPAEAVQAHRDLKSKQSLGMHFGTFQLSDEQYNQPPQDLEKAAQEAGLPAGSFRTLNVGETFLLR